MKLKKLISQKEMNKIAKTALAMVLAGSFTFSSSLAFADETTATEDNNLETVQLQDDTATDNTEVTTNTETTSDIDVEKPALVPGDFFYFAKLALEKVQLILTMDDVKEAELFAKFASERLAEAESLFAEGNEDLAIETIQKALEVMAKSNNVIEEKTEGTEVAESTETTVEGEETATPEETATTEETTTVEDTTATDDTFATEEDKGEVTEDVKTGTEESVEAPVNEDVEVVEEVQQILSQNIIALTAAMEKIQNPVAKAALQRNIEKSYAKLEKKLAKIEARLAKEAEEVEETEEQESAVTADVDTAVSTEVDPDGTEATETDATTDAVESETTTTVAPVVKVPVKKANKEVKQEVKKNKEEAKREIKEKREEFKKEVKEIKKEAKNKYNHDNKSHNDREHGKGEKGNK